MSDTINEQDKVEGTIEELPASDKPAEDIQEPTLPDDAKERTKEEFEKLKASNKELKEKLETLEVSKTSPSSVFDDLRPAQAVPQAAAPNVGNQQFVDDGGYVDATLLNSTITGTQKAAEEARQIAQRNQEEIQRFQETQIQREVQKEFPEFDSNNVETFSPSFYDFVKNELVGQLMKGEKQDLRAAAMKARETLGTAKTEPAKSKEDTISSREQASATTGTTKNIADLASEQDDLVKGTYKGDKEAIYKRLQASGN